jgi:chromate reductase
MAYILGISGSLRAASCNRKLLREAARLYGEAEYQEADLHLPLYEGDLESAEGIPASVAALVEAIKGAEAVIISTPEYNKAPSGVLKNALDWVSRSKPHPWVGKPVAVMSASSGRSGGERAQMILRSFMVPFRARVIAGPEMHLADCAKQVDEAGHLTGQLYIDTLSELMQALKSEARR